MPVLTNFKLPASAEALELPADQPFFFVSFLASTDPATGRPWCPDVVAALPHLRAAFADAAGPQVAFIEVGLRPEWRDSANVYRNNWNVTNVPTLSRYERINGKVQESGQLVEGEILDKKLLGDFIAGSAKKL